MRFRTARRLLAMLVALAALVGPERPAAAQGVPVDLELVLAVDVSGSMDYQEKLLQRDGYVAALRHPEVIAAITAGIHGRIALTYVEWAGTARQSVIMPWRLIDGPEAAEAAAQELARAPNARIRGTSIASALLFTARLFEESGFDGFRRVIDISGDGPNNMGPPLVTAREEVLAEGIVINGLPVVLNVGGGFAGVRLDIYYEDCVIGGPGAFAIPVWEADQFAEAIRRKLVLEIAGDSPRLVPATLQAPAPRIDCMIGERSRPRWLDDGIR